MQFNRAVIPYQQPPPYVPHKMHTINIDSYKVETNDSLINGNNNVIFGNNNTIYGNSNKIYGNNNKVVGNDNTVKGEGNAAEGARNEVSSPFGTSSQDSTSPFTNSSTTTSTPQSAAISIPRNTPMNQYPTPVSPRSYQETYPATSPTNYNMATSPVNYPMSTSLVAAYQMVSYPSQAIVPVAIPAPLQYAVVHYVNPFTTPVSVNPFESTKKEKEVDIIQDGTMVFMIREWESDYVREFCQLVQMTSGQKVGWHVSCGRTCIVGLGDLEKIRQAIIDLLPQLNMRLKEWSWNSFGNKVCSDRDLFEKRLFNEYKREDVECWRNTTPSASKAAA